MALINQLRCSKVTFVSRCFLCVALIAFQGRTDGLDISMRTIDGKRILYLNGGIDERDGDKVRRALRQHRFDEVWLKSPGGNLQEGIFIGTYLRESGAFLRVRRGDYCISACTVAFVGGLVRTIDAGASYEVHAYSGLLSGFRGRQGESKQAVERRILAEPAAYLTEHAKTEMLQRGAWWAGALYVYFRLMIQPGARAQLYSVLDSSEHRVVSRALLPFGERALQYYLTNMLANDVQRIEKEGLGTAHEIAMRIERDAMQAMLVGLNALDENNYLQRRSDKAIRMLSTMFESRILATSELSLETLSEYGYTNVPLRK